MKKLLLTTAATILFATTFSQRRVYVDIDATGTADGTSWANAYTNARIAFNNANKGDVFWIAEGTYIRQSPDRGTTFGWSKDSVSVYGGFDGTETALSQRDWENNPTIFSGEIQGDNDVTNNAYTVFIGPYGSSTYNINYSLIDGISINDGYATTQTTYNNTRWGAGMYLQQHVKAVDINNCTFENNIAQGAAALYVGTTSDDVDVTVTNTKFIGNKSSFANSIWVSGTGSRTANVKVVNSLFTGNINKNYGGLQNGSVFYFSSNGVQSHVAISLWNNTITQNIDSLSTGTNGQLIMLYQTDNSSFTLLDVRNSILYNNPKFANTTKNYYLTNYNFSNASFSNCISEINSYVSFTNRVSVNSLDPKFTDTNTGDFTLQATSPAIDSGNSGGITLPVSDLAGNARIYGTMVDLGCYEYTVHHAGVYENKEFASLKLFPNPTTGSITFESKEEIETIEIYNLTGQKVKTFFNTKRVDISEFIPGIYLARVMSGNKIATKKIIKN